MRAVHRKYPRRESRWDKEEPAPTAEVETSTPGRRPSGSALMASAIARVVATLERFISALWAAVHRVAMGSPAVQAATSHVLGVAACRRGTARTALALAASTNPQALAGLQHVLL